ncbi:protein of unknown function (plasmid) [Methylocella tundrae]|uniref:Uncharacterized protein n=1 Tax=Methylocella tundrae TaxID=227605 RepID=A0A4V6IN72_METTU|nr:protein of unknown function [Methylocella tundrae]
MAACMIGGRIASILQHYKQTIICEQLGIFQGAGNHSQKSLKLRTSMPSPIVSRLAL